jgi:hypothetical protein
MGNQYARRDPRPLTGRICMPDCACPNRASGVIGRLYSTMIHLWML